MDPECTWGVQRSMDNLSDWNLVCGRTLGSVGGSWEDKQGPIVAHPMTLKVALWHQATRNAYGDCRGRKALVWIWVRIQGRLDKARGGDVSVRASIALP